MEQLRIEREKHQHEMQMAERDHQLKVQEMQMNHQLKVEELKLKYHVQASTEGIEARKLGDTPERQDKFAQVTGALLEAIRGRRGLPKPPEGAA